MIELCAFSSNSWVLDIGCGTHICNNVQGMRKSRKLKQGNLDLFVGNKTCAPVEAIGSYELKLPSGLTLILDNCHYAPSISVGIISVSRLRQSGFIPL